MSAAPATGAQQCCRAPLAAFARPACAPCLRSV